MALAADQLEDRGRRAPCGACSPGPVIVKGARAYRAAAPIRMTVDELSSGRRSDPGEQWSHDVADFRSAPGSSKGCHVLLVEDDASIAELYATVLKANGHRVTRAVDGLAGLDAIRSDRFDLILLDIRMPRMDGLAMLRTVIGEQVATDTPVVILTNYDDSILRQEAADLGVKDYLLKSRTLPREIASQVSKWCQ